MWQVCVNLAVNGKLGAGVSLRLCGQVRRRRSAMDPPDTQPSRPASSAPTAATRATSAWRSAWSGQARPCPRCSARAVGNRRLGRPLAGLAAQTGAKNGPKAERQAGALRHGSTLAADAFPAQGFDFMLSTPHYGESWKGDLERMGGKAGISDPRFVVGHDGNPAFSLVTRSSDGQMLFPANMVSKMKRVAPLRSTRCSDKGGPLFRAEPIPSQVFVPFLPNGRGAPCGRPSLSQGNTKRHNGALSRTVTCRRNLSPRCP